ncbi:Gfo/Idh/MocA family oxidoreductase [Shewanella psychropiezotolerans]|uniref:Gfo/Idh/MocA family oxidoreductase n=1 Tax=Shewanella psychropiezotolerans TaxID=2593655 RepID=A0ABX5WWF2_9GAMM|nr:Gfo/Idh/MocA family oxidoreductase [Shewanella psychropiezotolerans]QDO83429.1 Gfo/Idh/MocA family oxidoreductase [Shewanella psychropiezotolerans]
MLKLLVIGPGLIGKKHIALICDNLRCKLEAIVTAHPAKHKDLSEDLCVPIYNLLDEALSHHQFDGAIIASPNNLHVSQAKVLLKNQIPLLIEKPLSSTIESAEELVHLSQTAQVPVLVGHHRTYSSYVDAAKKIITSPQFGRLVSVQASALFYKPTQYFLDGPWRTELGGGPILINLIHDIGMLRSLCGEIATVFAFGSNSQRLYEVEDTVAISFRFTNGALGTFLLSDCAASYKSWEMTSGENPAYPFFPNEASYHFSGTNGSLDYPNMKFNFFADKEKASWWNGFVKQEKHIDFVDPLEKQLDHFIDVIKRNAKPIVSAENGLMNMYVIEAISQSITQQRPISLRE